MMTQPQEDLGSRRILRSAHASMTATQTTIYLGVCEVHQVPVRETKLGLYPHLAPKHSRVLCFIDPSNEHEILGEKLIAVETSLTCDGTCRSARGRSCSCGCGGINHGDMWTRQYMLDHRELFEAQVAAYREEMARLEIKREKRREAAADRKRREFEQWMTEHADDVLFFMNEENIRSNFLRSMKEQLSEMKPLSEGQLRVVRTIRQEEAEGRARWQVAERQQREREAREAERQAARRPGQGDQDALQIGVYKLGEDIYVLKGNRTYLAWRKRMKTTGVAEPRPEEARLYAKRWVRKPARVNAGTGQTMYGDLEYASGVIFKIAPEDRMALEEAQNWTALYSQCIVCGTTLRAEKSVRAAQIDGMGPVCRTYF